MKQQDLSEVRLAVPADEPAIIGMLNAMHTETGIGRFNADRTRSVVQTGIFQNGGIIGVVRGPEDVEASIGLFLASSLCSEDLYLFEAWSFVMPPYRRSTHAKAMIVFAKHYAVELGVPLVVSVITNEQTARKERLFERQLPKAGSLFVFNNAAATENV